MTGDRYTDQTVELVAKALARAEFKATTIVAYDDAKVDSYAECTWRMRLRETWAALEALADAGLLAPAGKHAEQIREAVRRLDETINSRPAPDKSWLEMENTRRPA